MGKGLGKFDDRELGLSGIPYGWDIRSGPVLGKKESRRDFMDEENESGVVWSTKKLSFISQT